MNPLVLGSSPSGPTNSRCSGTIGVTIGEGRQLSQIPEKIGMSDSNCLQTVVANDRRGSGAAGHFRGNFGGNSKWRIGVTPTERDSSLACAKTKGLLAPASLSTALIRFRMPNSNWHIASLVSSGELAIEGYCSRYRPNPDVRHPKIVATNRSFVGLKSAKIAARQMALAE